MFLTLTYAVIFDQLDIYPFQLAWGSIRNFYGHKKQTHAGLGVQLIKDPGIG